MEESGHSVVSVFIQFLICWICQDEFLEVKIWDFIHALDLDSSVETTYDFNDPYKMAEQ